MFSWYICQIYHLLQLHVFRGFVSKNELRFEGRRLVLKGSQQMWIFLEPMDLFLTVYYHTIYIYVLVIFILYTSMLRHHISHCLLSCEVA